METIQLLVSGLANGCIYGLIALGFVLIYKATEAVNFAQGDMMMLGAFLTLGFANSNFLGLPFLIAVPLAILSMGVIGYLIDIVIIRRLFGQSQVAIVIVTIALGFVMRFAAGNIFGFEPQTLESPLIGRDVTVGGIFLGLDELLVIIATIGLTVGFWLYFSNTKLGIAMQAASQNQLAAYYMGIPVKRVQSLIWAIAGMMAAVAGILYASKGSIDPNAGLLGIKAFAAAVIGGMGSLPGALLGGIIVGMIEPFASRYIPAGYSQVMPYLLLFLMLVFRPHGILAQVHRKKV
ncbi:branched-chain amino acid ABC transporter permease [Notoacmeibacter marinus]|uniref:Branched-chain amino acid ABC transporter permease n=1 Tax=Notoacmeibacter marinus TaxID=1876515 RepID=A0A231UXW3_9HYPH|nr:branched-chain amino acid ABC transporter permease [Notoacmeibacter marinus]OXT00730.1 branched-chain amino acid ABC transporter permease [Notoacmeibacter marinus]